jgi:hypothetical protein
VHDDGASAPVGDLASRRAKGRVAKELLSSHRGCVRDKVQEATGIIGMLCSLSPSSLLLIDM